MSWLLDRYDGCWSACTDAGRAVLRSARGHWGMVREVERKKRHGLYESVIQYKSVIRYKSVMQYKS
eukprot:1018496-Prorocentrum_lima.AAC.1